MVLAGRVSSRTGAAGGSALRALRSPRRDQEERPALPRAFDRTWRGYRARFRGRELNDLRGHVEQGPRLPQRDVINPLMSRAIEFC
jgi:hypothetical protein